MLLRCSRTAGVINLGYGGAGETTSGRDGVVGDVGIGDGGIDNDGGTDVTVGDSGAGSTGGDSGTCSTGGDGGTCSTGGDDGGGTNSTGGDGGEDSTGGEGETGSAGRDGGTGVADGDGAARVEAMLRGNCAGVNPVVCDGAGIVVLPGAAGEGMKDEWKAL